jgi:hypothetical protein
MKHKVLKKQGESVFQIVNEMLTETSSLKGLEKLKFFCSNRARKDIAKRVGFASYSPITGEREHT